MAPGARRWSFAAALLAASLTAAGAAAARPHAYASSAVGVGAREFRFAVYRATVPAGTVSFDVTNYGEDAHDLVVLDRRGRVIGRTGKVRAGAHGVVSVRLAPGTYRLRCDLANHARLGMHATIRVVR
jgi:plastocyanin